MAGPLVVGDNSLSGNTQAGGLAKSDVVKLLQNDQLPDFTAGVTVNSAGLLDLNGNSDTIGVLTLQSGTSAASTVATGAGTLTLTGNLYVGKTCVERGVPAAVADERLIELIKARGRWQEPEPEED